VNALPHVTKTQKLFTSSPRGALPMEEYTRPIGKFRGPLLVSGHFALLGVRAMWGHVSKLVVGNNYATQ
jgi:hypothetical protein